MTSTADGEQGNVAGIDCFSPAEERKRRSRALRGGGCGLPGGDASWLWEAGGNGM